VRYEKGRKDASRRHIMEVASEKFREDGIAASGLAGIMSDAGLTNGAFYPHFRSKADLVREVLDAAFKEQSTWLETTLATGGLEAAVATYLSPEHRDNPGKGCAAAALLPELARLPSDARALFAEHLERMANQLSLGLPENTRDRDNVALSIYATIIGTLQLSRAVEGTELSDRILVAGAEATRALARRSD
jgi:TetR/AcrR family transcriptional repressor of nem operon